jgi:hypothetical protein
LTRLFLKALGLILFCYALFGRGFAYLGLPPLYPGEFVLMMGCVVLIADARARGAIPTRSSVAWFAIYVLCGWGVLRTVPYVAGYGMDALRDGAVWGYAAFGVVLYALITTYPQNLPRILSGYRRFAQAYPYLIFMVLALVVAGFGFPTLPVTGVPLVVVKPGDVGVHLGGIALLWLVGLAGSRGPVWMSFLLASSFVVAVMSRGAMLAFLTPAAVYVLVRRDFPRHVRAAALGGTLVILAALAANPRVELRPGRWLQPRQIVENFTSTVSSGDDQSEELQATKAWRLAWWGVIVNYTFAGDRFWLGKGFGVDLAADDGFASDATRANRYPHSVHMNFLARAGVPGLALWLLVLILWGRVILQYHARSRRDGEEVWSALFLFMFGYWAAFLVNASFDVFLEGPMGGVWFWSLMGVGLAATQIYHRGAWMQRALPSPEWADTHISPSHHAPASVELDSNA